MLFRTVAAPAALLATLICGGGARAQVAMTDTIKGDDLGQTATNTSSTSDTVNKTYMMFTASPSAVTNKFTGQDTAAGYDPMPEPKKVTSAISYKTPQPPDPNTAANTIYTNNNIDETGTDPEATALTNTVYAASNIQGMAIDNLTALQARLKELDEMNNALAGAKSITEIAAINGRIAVEALAVQAQQAQAANLTALATAQNELDITNREQAIRQEHQNTVTLFPAKALSLFGVGG